MKLRQQCVTAVIAVATLLAGGGLAANIAYASDDIATNTVTINPWYSNGPFKGWGTSLAWFANATGNYGEPGSITTSSGDANADAQALEYGKTLRSEFYNSIFGKSGLGLNMARYNIGGGNASDVAYGYPFMRQGAAVPGTWADDPTGAQGLYGGVTTKQADKDALDSAFDPTNNSNYDWSKAKAQDWWVKQGAATGDITHWEAFANSAPWFMTNSGYAAGGFDSSANNLKDPQKFAQYLAKNVEHLESSYGINVNTVEPLNESETNYWSTPNKMASQYVGGTDANAALINRYVSREYADKDLSVTPYADSVKKPQEGMHVSYENQIPLINSLYQALQGNPDTVISSTDASVQSQFVKSYNSWMAKDPSIITAHKIGQYNVHSYGADAPRQVRDIAQTDGKVLSMSEVDGSWQDGGFNPFGFNNALGITGKINADVYNLQSQDWTFWQVVEDLYNMQLGSTNANGQAINPPGENTNWGTILIDFDCTVAGKDGKLYSQRRVDNNNGTTEGLQPCNVLVNSKFNGMRAYTQFVHEGDSVLANSAQDNNFTAQSADGTVQTVINTNASSSPRKLVIDLSNYASIDSHAAGTAYFTQASSDADSAQGADYATPEVMSKTSNVKQGEGTVVVDAAAKTATLTVPARTIASIQLKGVTGVSDQAPGVKDGAVYQLIGKQSGKALSATPSGDSALSLQDTAATPDQAQQQTWKFSQVDVSKSARPTLREYVIQTADGKVLVSRNGTNALVSESLGTAQQDPSALWIMNTENGSTWSFVNVAAKQSMDVDGNKTNAGTKVGLWISSGSDNQAWQLKSTLPLGTRTAQVQTAVGVMPTLPQEVVPFYSWGDGQSVAVSWNTEQLKNQVAKAGAYEVSGTATDVFGNPLTATLTVNVGSFTVTDPTSITVAAGSAASEVSKLAPASVNAHVGNSAAIPTDVTWDFKAVNDSALAVPGVVTVQGVAQNGSGKTIPATLRVYVTTAVAGNGDNLAAAFRGNAQASSTEGTYYAANTCDNNVKTPWSNWKNGGGDTDPWLSYTFDSARKLNSLDFVSYGEATPKSFAVQYVGSDGVTWKDSGIVGTTGANIGQGNTTTVNISTLPATRGVRLKLTYADNANYYAKVAEVRIFEAVSAPSKADDATLGALRADGIPVKDFDSSTENYQVEYSEQAQQYPSVSAYASDTAATVQITQADQGNGGKATIAVTSANGTAQKTYTVTFVATNEPDPNPDPKPQPAEPTNPNSGQAGNQNADGSGNALANTGASVAMFVFLALAICGIAGALLLMHRSQKAR